MATEVVVVVWRGVAWRGVVWCVCGGEGGREGGREERVLSVVGCRLSVVGCRLSVVGCR